MSVMHDYIKNMRAPASLEADEDDSDLPYTTLAREDVDSGLEGLDDQSELSGLTDPGTPPVTPALPSPGEVPTPAPARDPATQADPMLAQYISQSRARDLQRQGSDKAEQTINYGQALSRAALGVNTPQSMDGFYANMNAQNKGHEASADADMTRQAAVMRAIQASKLGTAKYQAMADAKRAALEGQNTRFDAQLTETARHNKAMEGHAAAGKSDHDIEKQKKVYNDTIQQLETMRGNPAVSQAEKDLYAAQKFETLLKRAAPDGDLNKLSEAQLNLAVMETAKIAAGGQASEAELHSLAPGAVQGAMAKFWGKYANEPTRANAAAFVQQYKDYVAGLREDAASLIKERYGRLIGTKKSELNPEQLESLNSNYTNRFDSAAPAKSTAPAGFPRVVTSADGTKRATVSNEQEAAQAAAKGFH